MSKRHTWHIESKSNDWMLIDCPSQKTCKSWVHVELHNELLLHKPASQSRYMSFTPFSCIKIACCCTERKQRQWNKGSTHHSRTHLTDRQIKSRGGYRKYCQKVATKKKNHLGGFRFSVSSFWRSLWAFSASAYSSLTIRYCQEDENGKQISVESAPPVRIIFCGYDPHKTILPSSALLRLSTAEWVSDLTACGRIAAERSPFVCWDMFGYKCKRNSLGWIDYIAISSAFVSWPLGERV